MATILSRSQCVDGGSGGAIDLMMTAWIGNALCITDPIRLVTIFDVLVAIGLNKMFYKQSSCRWLETPCCWCLNKIADALLTKSLNAFPSVKIIAFWIEIQWCLFRRVPLIKGQHCFSKRRGVEHVKRNITCPLMAIGIDHNALLAGVVGVGSHHSTSVSGRC